LRGHVLEHSSLHRGEGEEHMEPAREAPDDQRQEDEQPRELHRRSAARTAILLLQAQVIGLRNFLPTRLTPERLRPGSKVLAGNLDARGPERKQVETRAPLFREWDGSQRQVIGGPAHAAGPRGGGASTLAWGKKLTVTAFLLNLLALLVTGSTSPRVFLVSET